MRKFEHLESLNVANPCSKSWDELTGSDRVRHCDACQKNVHNLSAMTKKQANALIATEERVCVRYKVDRAGKPAFKLPWAMALLTALISSFGCRETTGEVAGGIPTQNNASSNSGDETVGKLAAPVKPNKIANPKRSELVGDINVTLPKKKH